MILDIEYFFRGNLCSEVHILATYIYLCKYMLINLLYFEFIYGNQSEYISEILSQNVIVRSIHS